MKTHRFFPPILVLALLIVSGTSALTASATFAPNTSKEAANLGIMERVDRSSVTAPASLNTVSAPQADGPIVADHTVVDRYDDIPQEYIDIVKTMWLDVPGESHSSGYRKGCELLEAADPRYQVNVVESGTPEGPTDQHLRVSRATRNAYNNWSYGYGEANWYTNAQAITRTKDHLSYANTHDLEIAAMGFGWCWDMTWHNNPTGTVDSTYQVRWAGSSEGGPDGDKAWGLDEGDYALTDNRVNMNTYISATEEYIAHCAANGYPTAVFFTTGPVDGGGSGENRYQRYLKHEHIRAHVQAHNRVLFDYADILSWGDDGTLNTDTWNGSDNPPPYDGVPRTFPHIHPDNMKDLDGSYEEDGDHIGERGALRLAKAMWWMLARLAGWDGNSTTSDRDGNWSTADTWAGDIAPGINDKVILAAGTTITLDAGARCDSLTILHGATLIIPDGMALTVTTNLANLGAMQQTHRLDNAGFAFLEIGSGGTIHYRGASVTSTHNLGLITAQVRALAEGESCTDAGPSASYAGRCFEITAQNDDAATVRLWALTDEMDSGLTLPRVFRYVAPTWVELDQNVVSGEEGDYTFAQADTPGFSHFLIAQSGSTPTAISQREIDARGGQPPAWLLVALALALLCGAAWELGRLRQRLK